MMYFFGQISSECSAHNSEVRLKVEPVCEYTYAQAIKVSSETCFAFENHGSKYHYKEYVLYLLFDTQVQV